MLEIYSNQMMGQPSYAGLSSKELAIRSASEAFNRVDTD
jgi:hypothetical protein